MQSRYYSASGMGLALLLSVLADFRPVFFSDIVIYFHDQSALSVEAVQSIATRSRNPICVPSPSVEVVGFESAPL